MSWEPVREVLVSVTRQLYGECLIVGNLKGPENAEYVWKVTGIKQQPQSSAAYHHAHGQQYPYLCGRRERGCSRCQLAALRGIGSCL